jgi:transcriptional regulator with XRE-family HTH domain
MRRFPVTIDQNTLGAAIKAVRIARGLTQAALAKKVGFSNGGIALIEQGRRTVSMATLNEISTALGVPPGCLAILGSHTKSKNKSLSHFVESLQKLITKLIVTQNQLSVRQDAEQERQKAMEPFYEKLSEATELFDGLIADIGSAKADKVKFRGGHTTAVDAG